jgi:ATP-dependent Lhr-like helicase
LVAIDPANPWGAVLAWPERADPEAPNPRRVVGAWVLLRGGQPVAFVETGLRGLVLFAGEASTGAPEAAALADALLLLARARRRRSVRLTRIDGRPAARTALGVELLRAKRALADGDGLWLEG